MSALDHALQLHGQGRLDDARQAYLDILNGQPDDDAALHYLGILEHQCGRSEAGLDLLARALDLVPPQAERLNDLGNVLSQLERLDDAQAAFSAATTLSPHDANLHNNLGSVLARLDRLPEAEAAFRHALTIDASFVPALNNLGDLCMRLGHSDEAAQYHCQAFVSGPLIDKPKRMLGIAYYTLNRIAEAAEVYRQWCVDEPHNPVARHLLAACSGQDVPARAIDHRGGLLVADDVGNTIWRVTAASGIATRNRVVRAPREKNNSILHGRQRRLDRKPHLYFSSAVI